MASGVSLTRLIGAVAREPSPLRALQRVAAAALNLTNSRHALIAALNEEIGDLEIRTVVGADESMRDARLPLEVGRHDGIVGFVAATGATVMTGNARAEPHYRMLFPQTESELAVPIRDANGRIRAVLNVESDRRDAYGDPSRELVSALADLAAMILEREAHARREEALMRVGEALGSAITEAAMIEQVVRVADDVLRLQACSIFLLDPAGDCFMMRGTSGNLKEYVGQVSYGRGEGFTGWVCDSGQPILLDNPHEDPRWRGKYVEFPSEQVASFLAAPIVHRGRSIGAIRALRKKSDNPFFDNRFRQDDLRLLQAIAEQLAVGLESVQNMERILRSERMIAWGELSAKSSHMIGNRVFALKGDINELQHVLEEPAPRVDELRDLQASLATNVNRVEEILQDFRDFVTATKLDRRTGDLNQVLRETAAEVFPRRSTVELQLELDESLPPFAFDGKRLRRAISELIENSLNYMDQGRLRLSSRHVPSERGPAIAQIEVEDTGPGVDPERKALIFQPFYSGRVKGMGLGLSIVKGIVDAHGGEVFEAGEEGAGAKFVIRVPVVE